MGTAVAAVAVALILWGGNQWWAAEALSYGQFGPVPALHRERRGQQASAIATC